MNDVDYWRGMRRSDESPWKFVVEGKDGRRGKKGDTAMGWKRKELGEDEMR